MSARAVITAFVLGFLFTLALVPVVKRFAVLCGALDKPNARKVHQVPIPLWGGLGIFLGYVLSLGTVIWLSKAFQQAVTSVNIDNLTGMTIAAFMMVVVGMIDDRFGMPAKVKLGLQLITAAVMVYFGIRVDYLTIPFYGVVFLQPWMACLITMFWVAGITNALNLLDGLDGLLAGVSLTTALVFLVVSIIKGQNIMSEWLHWKF